MKRSVIRHSIRQMEEIVWIPSIVAMACFGVFLLVLMLYGFIQPPSTQANYFAWYSLLYILVGLFSRRAILMRFLRVVDPFEEEYWGNSLEFVGWNAVILWPVVNLWLLLLDMSYMHQSYKERRAKVKNMTEAERELLEVQHELAEAEAEHKHVQDTLDTYEKIGKCRADIKEKRNRIDEALSMKEVLQ